jgi:hypothetical protein
MSWKAKEHVGVRISASGEISRDDYGVEMTYTFDDHEDYKMTEGEPWPDRLHEEEVNHFSTSLTKNQNERGRFQLNTVAIEDEKADAKESMDVTMNAAFDDATASLALKMPDYSPSALDVRAKIDSLDYGVQLDMNDDGIGAGNITFKSKLHPMWFNITHANDGDFSHAKFSLTDEQRNTLFDAAVGYSHGFTTKTLDRTYGTGDYWKLDLDATTNIQGDSFDMHSHGLYNMSRDLVLRPNIASYAFSLWKQVVYDYIALFKKNEAVLFLVQNKQTHTCTGSSLYYNRTCKYGIIMEVDMKENKTKVEWDMPNEDDITRQKLTYTTKLPSSRITNGGGMNMNGYNDRMDMWLYSFKPKEVYFSPLMHLGKDTSATLEDYGVFLPAGVEDPRIKVITVAIVVSAKSFPLSPKARNALRHAIATVTGVSVSQITIYDNIDARRALFSRSLDSAIAKEVYFGISIEAPTVKDMWEIKGVEDALGVEGAVQNALAALEPSLKDDSLKIVNVAGISVDNEVGIPEITFAPTTEDGADDSNNMTFVYIGAAAGGAAFIIAVAIFAVKRRRPLKHRKSTDLHDQVDIISNPAYAHTHKHKSTKVPIHTDVELAPTFHSPSTDVKFEYTQPRRPQMNV